MTKRMPIYLSADEVLQLIDAGGWRLEERESLFLTLNDLYEELTLADTD